MAHLIEALDFYWQTAHCPEIKLEVYGDTNAKALNEIKNNCSKSTHNKVVLDFLLCDSTGYSFKAFYLSQRQTDDSGEKVRKPLETKIKFSFSENDASMQKIFASRDEYVVWISSFSGNSVLIRYVKCGVIDDYADEYSISIHDKEAYSYSKNFELETYGEDRKFIPDSLMNDFSFSLDGRSYLFIKKYFGEENFQILGSVGILDVNSQIETNTITKIIKKPFPRNHQEFAELQIRRYRQLSFQFDSSAARSSKALAKRASGETILGLWKKYSKVELDRAERNRDSIGDISIAVTDVNWDISLFKFMVKLKLSEKQRKFFRANSANIDLLVGNLVEFYADSDITHENRKTTLRVLSISSDLNSAELCGDDDECLHANDKGVIRLSTAGSQLMFDRRVRAEKEITDPHENKSVLKLNLRFIIEGETDSLCEFKRPRKMKPMSARCREFMKRTFGIDQLTEDQEKAVEIALNTPDVAIIQGPPGTGKSTVMSVIAYRLMENSEKEQMREEKKHSDKEHTRNVDKDRVIMASAFQHDTVEHISSKLYTYGLPTPIVGQKKNSVDVGALLKARLLSRIDDSMKTMQEHGACAAGISEFRKLENLLKSGKSPLDVKNIIDRTLIKKLQDRNLTNELNGLFTDFKKSDRDIAELMLCFDSLPVAPEFYKNEGEDKLIEAIAIDSDLVIKDELDSIEDMISSSVIDEQKLSAIKSSVVDRAKRMRGTLLSRFSDALCKWLEKAEKLQKNLLMSGYGDNADDFVLSVLSDLRSDIECDTGYVVRSLAKYTKCLGATNQGAGRRELQDVSVENVILEEAARSNPLDLLIPMTKAQERIILVGDQNQLPHLVDESLVDEAIEALSDESKEHNSKFDGNDFAKRQRDMYKDSLFGIMFNNLDGVTPVRRVTLSKQFRMHSVIGNFISKTFYDGKISSELVDDRKKIHNLSVPYLKGKVASWVNVPIDEGKESSSCGSKVRKSEAEKVSKVLQDILHDSNSKELSIGIITFYSQQVDCIYEELCKENICEEIDGEYRVALRYQLTHDGREKLRIGSVDSFQGKEFDIVILSSVRSNDEYTRPNPDPRKAFGFLMLQNRLNVAFSRAQRLIIAIGDRAMFSNELSKQHVHGMHEYLKLVESQNG